MNNNYVLLVKIEKNVTDIMNLPCVNGCFKDEDNTLVYDVTVENYNDCAGGIAYEGDLLCQKSNGAWVLEKGAGR